MTLNYKGESASCWLSAKLCDFVWWFLWKFWMFFLTCWHCMEKRHWCTHCCFLPLGFAFFLPYFPPKSIFWKVWQNGKIKFHFSILPYLVKRTIFSNFCENKFAYTHNWRMRKYFAAGVLTQSCFKLELTYGYYPMSTS